MATWGIVDTFHEKVQMTLAIPGSTLRDTLGLSRLAHDYYLKVGHLLGFIKFQLCIHEWCQLLRKHRQLEL